MSELAQRNQDLEQAGPAATSLISLVRSDDYTREQIRSALPASVSLDSFTRATVTALMENEELAKADQKSLFQSIVKCAQDGLLPNGREAALVIYRTKVKQDGKDVWVDKVQYLPMIAGARRIAAEYGWTLHTHAIYANDKFEVDLGSGVPVHVPTLLGERGELVGAWAKATHRDGRTPIVEVMTRADVERAMGSSKGADKDYSPWKKWTDRMWEKTVGHRIAKKLPLDPQDAQRLTRVIEATELAPGEAAAALYGPADSTFSELPAGTTLADQLPSTPTSTEDTGAVPEEPSAGAAPPSGGGSDLPSEEDGAPVAAPIAVEEVEAAKSYIPPAGIYSIEGSDGPRTLAEIHALGDKGEKWLLKCAVDLPDSQAEWRGAVRAYVAAFLPEQKAA